MRRLYRRWDTKRSLFGDFVVLGFVVAQCLLAFAFPVSTAYLVVLVSVTLAYVAWFVRFALNPISGSSLKPVAELYGLVSIVGLIVDLAWPRGVAWLGWP